MVLKQVIHVILCSNPWNFISSLINIDFYLLDILHISSLQVRRVLDDIVLNLTSPISLSFWVNQ